jgi:hypothetical protein
MFYSVFGINVIGDITLSAATITQNIFQLADIREVGDLTFPLSTTLSLCGANSKLGKIGVINAPLVSNINQFCMNNTEIREIVFTSCSAVTEASFAFYNASSLAKLITPGLTIGVALNGTAMTATAFNEWFTSLGTANGAQTIAISGKHPGKSTCDTSIATAKGFTVTIT